MAPLRLALIAASIFICVPSSAQVPDSVAGRGQVPDSVLVATEADSVAGREQVRTSVAQLLDVGFPEQDRGIPLTDSLPTRLPYLNLSEVASRTPAAFTYLFGTAGWPDGASFWGLPPGSATAIFNDLPFTHIFTGRPADDLVPLAFVNAPRLEVNRHGHPVALSARLRDFSAPRPLTEGRYWKGGEGLQSIDVVHVQNRRRTLFGTPGLLNIMGAYSGRAATGEYPGSALRRGRQLHVRGRYAQPAWSLEILNVHNRRRVGAHGGVIPDEDFNSIYLRTGALVENQEAERRLIRNDLSATFRWRMLREVTTVAGFWTAETFRYRDAGDTLRARSNRLGVRAARPLFGIVANVEAWVDRVSLSQGREARGVLHAYLSDSLSALGWRAAVTAGAHLLDGTTMPGAFVGASRSMGSITASFSASLSGDPAASIDETGFGTLRGLSGAGSGGVLQLQGGIGYAGRVADVFFGGFFSRAGDPIDYYAEGLDSAAVLEASSPIMRAGVYADLGWRREAERGFYATMKPSVVQILNGDDSPLHVRSSDALPRLFGQGRLGMRYLLFRGDLDLDAYVEAAAWSTFRSRTLHPQSGLLVLPLEGARAFGPASMVDLVLEAGIREAKVFVMYRNALSGTALMPGNLIVPNYPLPAREFRIGVFWPIDD